MPDTHTILAGDLVASSDLDDSLPLAVVALEETAVFIERWIGAPVHFTRNRGDGWQISLPPDRPGLREALAFRAGLRRADRRFDTRIAIATGQAEIAGPDLNAATGAAFTEAGHMLDSLTGAEIDHAGGGALSAVAILASELSRGWTQAQARAVLPMLAPEPPTHAEIAQAYGVTRQAINQALAGAGYPALSRALARIEAPE